MIGVLAAATVYGAMKGLVWQLASISAIVVSYLVAFQFRGVLAAQIPAEPPWNIFLAMLILYVLTSMLVWLIFQCIKGVMDNLQLKEFDHQIGGILGAAKGVLLCVVITLFAITLSGDAQRQSIVNSKSGYYIAVLLNRSHTIIPDEFHDVLEPYIHSLDGDYDLQDRRAPGHELPSIDRADQTPATADENMAAGTSPETPRY